MTIREVLIGVEDWMDDESMLLSMAKFFLVLGGAIAVCILAIGAAITVFGSESQEQKCLRAGGAWAIVGSHRETRTLIVGKVIIPQQVQVTEYGCIALPKP